jgi:hypothetical protein
MLRFTSLTSLTSARSPSGAPSAALHARATFGALVPGTILLGVVGAIAALAALASAGCDLEEGPPPTGSGFTCEGDVCTVTGPIVENVTFTADKKWLLKGGVFVGDDADPAASPATLTIEPGTTVFGDTSTLSFLLVTRGSRLVADGTAEAPIVFTSAKEAGRRARGDWGGIVVNGRAPVNGCAGDPCTLLGEAGTGTYGGDDPDDDSGVLRFVRVEFGGALIDAENELNAFGFQGVGRGTVIDHVQAHRVADDCIEFFGGTADASHVVCTGVGDDNLDWTFGWSGRLQLLVAQQYDDAGGNGIEADNNEGGFDLAPVSEPTIANITLVGVPGSANSGIGVLLRRGTRAHLHNAVVTGFNTRCFDMDDDATFATAVQGDALTGETTVSNSVFDCATLTDDAAADPFALTDFLTTLNTGNVTGDPGLLAPRDLEAPDFRPAAKALAATGGAAPDDAFFEAAAFRGGMDPEGDPWTAGWTAFPAN